MGSYRSALVIFAAGAVTFALVFTLLQVTRSEASSGEALVVAATPETPTPEAVPVARATDSLAPLLASGDVAVGVPSAGSEPLLQAVQSGDRLDVVASLPSPGDTRPVTAVVVSGATVLHAATVSDPLLLEVSSADALVLAHLILSETHLSFVVWSNAGSPPPRQSLDEQTARAVLGLPTIVATSTSMPTPTATPVPVVLSATPILTPTPTDAGLYTVQAGESLESVATRLGVDTAVLWWTNRTQVDPVSPLVAGTRLHVPLVPGFLYQVQPGDTWDSVAATFSSSAATLRQRNEQSEDASLPPGSLVFIPRSTT